MKETVRLALGILGLILFLLIIFFGSTFRWGPGCP